MKGLFRTLALAALVLAAGTARAETSDGCVDTWPEDHQRPKFVEHFPTKGTSGHVEFLELKVTHPSGQRVFPAGIGIAPDSEEHGWLKEAHFRLPDESSTVAPKVVRGSSANGEKQFTTEVRIPLIPLPDEAGRTELTLPRLPIAVSRASGQVHTICTQPHVITVEDPIASIANPQKEANPKARPQTEVWTALRDGVLIFLAAIPVALALFWLFLLFKRRVKKAPPPEPPRPPWERALERLSEIEALGLLKKQEYEEFLDRVSDTLREYLGNRYGFDGLESTTRETMRRLTSLASDFSEDRAVRMILQRADLVKFARRLPSEEECVEALSETRRLVHITTVSSPSKSAVTEKSSRASAREKEDAREK